MSKTQFETLKEMGIDNVKDIEKYSSRIEGDVDILKVYFHRHSGEWFAKSKKFKFKRFQKNLKVDEGTIKYRTVTEPSAYFLRAVAELDQLVAVERKTEDKKALLLEEVEHLEKVMQRKIDDIRRQIEAL